MKRVLWSNKEIKTLRQSAGKKSVPLIAKSLGRTVAAVRFKAVTIGLSLSMR